MVAMQPGQKSFFGRLKNSYNRLSDRVIGGGEDASFIATMILPAGIVFIIGIAFPLLYGLFISFFYIDIFDPELRDFGPNTFVHILNYVDLLSDSDFMRFYFNTIFFTVVTVTFELFLGLAVALLLNKKFKGRGIVRAAVLVPWAIPTIINAKIWYLIFLGDKSGLINDIFYRLGIIAENADPMLFFGGSSSAPLSMLWIVSLFIFPVTLGILAYSWFPKVYRRTFDFFDNFNEFVTLAIFLVTGFIVFILPDSFYMPQAGVNINPIFALSYFLLPILLAFTLPGLIRYIQVKKWYIFSDSPRGHLIFRIVSGVLLLTVLMNLLTFVLYPNPLSVYTIDFPIDFVVVFIVDIWKTTPFMALLILADLQTIPHDLYKAAEVDGASRWQTFRQVTLPLIIPGIGTALIFRCIDAFRVYDILAVFSGDSIASLTYEAVKQYQNGYMGTSSAIAIFTFLNIITFVVFMMYLTRRRTDS